MPIYEFQKPDGTIVERLMPVEKAPDIGKMVTIDGEKCRRIASSVGGKVSFTGYVSERLPRNLKGVECTPGGKPIIDSHATERNVAAALGWERE